MNVGVVEDEEVTQGIPSCTKITSSLNQLESAIEPCPGSNLKRSGVSTDKLCPCTPSRTKVLEAQFQQDDSHWNIVTESKRYCAEVVIFAVGQLHEPHHPDILGLGDFRGPVFHSAEWNDDIDLCGKRISVIGTGSSAAQMLPTLASLWLWETYIGSTI